MIRTSRQGPLTAAALIGARRRRAAHRRHRPHAQRARQRERIDDLLAEPLREVRELRRRAQWQHGHRARGLARDDRLRRLGPRLHRRIRLRGHAGQRRDQGDRLEVGDVLRRARQRFHLGIAHADVVGEEDHVELGALGGLLIEGSHVEFVPHLIAQPLDVAIEIGIRKWHALRVQEILEAGHGGIVRLPAFGKMGFGPVEVGVAEAEQGIRIERIQAAFQNGRLGSFVLFVRGDSAAAVHFAPGIG